MIPNNIATLLVVLTVLTALFSYARTRFTNSFAPATVALTGITVFGWYENFSYFSQTVHVVLVATLLFVGYMSKNTKTVKIANWLALVASLVGSLVGSLPGWFFAVLVGRIELPVWTLAIGATTLVVLGGLAAWYYGKWRSIRGNPTTPVTPVK